MAAQMVTATVEVFRWITPTVFEIELRTEPSFTYEAGQFVSVIVPGAGPKGRDLRRAYSIASSPEDRLITLCVKKVEGGPGSTYLSQLTVGQSFRGMAPYGDFVYKTEPTRQACFIATGTGIAPFRGMMRSEHFKRNRPIRALSLLGVRTEDELIYGDELRALSGIEVLETVSQPKAPGYSGRKGRVTDILRELPSDFAWECTDFYLCGNGEMIKEVETILASHGVAKEFTHKEKYY